MRTPQRRSLLRMSIYAFVLLLARPVLGLECEYTATNDWGSGFTASITISNNTNATVNGWNVSWQHNGSLVTAAWSAEVSGNNPYTAINMGWNGMIAPATSVSFGFQGSGEDSSGQIVGCLADGDNGNSSSLSSSSLSSSSSSLVSSIASSIERSSSSSEGLSSASSVISRSSASSESGACVCNWYGSAYPLCEKQDTGWGWENNNSCIGSSTCDNQWDNGGVECDCVTRSSSSSSFVTSSSSSLSSSSLSVVSSSSSLSSNGLYPNYNINPVAPTMTGMESTAIEMASRISLGWNIGNTLEAIGGETAWGNPKVSDQLIQRVKASGFDAIRIPASWDQYANQSTAEIDAVWLDRVKDVVEICLANDMPVILNIHWDGGWLENNITPEKQVENNAKQRAFWQQIATHLRDFDERLMFAGTNEPNVDSADQMAVLMTYHQTFIDAVRETGGNNAYRILVVQGPSTDIEKTNQLMSQMPSDTVEGRLMAEVHFYTPYQFTLMGEDASWGNQFFYWGEGNHSSTDTAHNPTWGEEAFIDELFVMMKQQFVDNGIPVVLGEYSAMRRTETLFGDDLALHLQSRAYWHKYVTERALANGLLPFYWDAGGLNGNSSGIFDRNANSVFDTQTMEALIQGAGK